MTDSRLLAIWDEHCQAGKPQAVTVLDAMRQAVAEAESEGTCPPCNHPTALHLPSGRCAASLCGCR